MTEIIQLERSRSRIYGYADNYVRIMREQGWMAAGQYLAESVPEQFYNQVKLEVEKLTETQ